MYVKQETENTKSLGLDSNGDHLVFHNPLIQIDGNGTVLIWVYYIE